MCIFIIIISLTALLLEIFIIIGPTNTAVKDYQEGLKSCPVCGKEIDKDSRKGIRIGECPFCGKPAKNK